MKHLYHFLFQDPITRWIYLEDSEGVQANSDLFQGTERQERQWDQTVGDITEASWGEFVNHAEPVKVMGIPVGRSMKGHGENIRDASLFGRELRFVEEKVDTVLMGPITGKRTNEALKAGFSAQMEAMDKGTPLSDIDQTLITPTDLIDNLKFDGGVADEDALNNFCQFVKNLFYEGEGDYNITLRGAEALEDYVKSATEKLWEWEQKSREIENDTHKNQPILWRWVKNLFSPGAVPVVGGLNIPIVKQLSYILVPQILRTPFADKTSLMFLRSKLDRVVRSAEILRRNKELQVSSIASNISRAFMEADGLPDGGEKKERLFWAIQTVLQNPEDFVDNDPDFIQAVDNRGNYKGVIHWESEFGPGVDTPMQLLDAFNYVARGMIAEKPRLETVSRDMEGIYDRVHNRFDVFGPSQEANNTPDQNPPPDFESVINRLQGMGIEPSAGVKRERRDGTEIFRKHIRLGKGIDEVIQAIKMRGVTESMLFGLPAGEDGKGIVNVSPEEKLAYVVRLLSPGLNQEATDRAERDLKNYRREKAGIVAQLDQVQADLDEHLQQEPPHEAAELAAFRAERQRLEQAVEDLYTRFETLNNRIEQAEEAVNSVQRGDILESLDDNALQILMYLLNQQRKRVLKKRASGSFLEEGDSLYKTGRVRREVVDLASAAGDLEKYAEELMERPEESLEAKQAREAETLAAQTEVQRLEEAVENAENALRAFPVGNQIRQQEIAVSTQQREVENLQEELEAAREERNHLRERHTTMQSNLDRASEEFDNLAEDASRADREKAKRAKVQAQQALDRFEHSQVLPSQEERVRALEAEFRAVRRELNNRQGHLELFQADPDYTRAQQSLQDHQSQLSTARGRLQELTSRTSGINTEAIKNFLGHCENYVGQMKRVRKQIQDYFGIPEDGTIDPKKIADIAEYEEIEKIMRYLENLEQRIIDKYLPSEAQDSTEKAKELKKRILLAARPNEEYEQLDREIDRFSQLSDSIQQGGQDPRSDGAPQVTDSDVQGMPTFLARSLRDMKVGDALDKLIETREDWRDAKSWFKTFTPQFGSLFHHIHRVGDVFADVTERYYPETPARQGRIDFNKAISEGLRTQANYYIQRQRRRGEAANQAHSLSSYMTSRLEEQWEAVQQFPEEKYGGGMIPCIRYIPATGTGQIDAWTATDASQHEEILNAFIVRKDDGLLVLEGIHRRTGRKKLVKIEHAFGNPLSTRNISIFDRLDENGHELPAGADRTDKWYSMDTNPNHQGIVVNLYASGPKSNTRHIPRRATPDPRQEERVYDRVRLDPEALQDRPVHNERDDLDRVTRNEPVQERITQDERVERSATPGDIEGRITPETDPLRREEVGDQVEAVLTRDENPTARAGEEDLAARAGEEVVAGRIQPPEKVLALQTSLENIRGTLPANMTTFLRLSQKERVKALQQAGKTLIEVLPEVMRLSSKATTGDGVNGRMIREEAVKLSCTYMEHVCTALPPKESLRFLGQWTDDIQRLTESTENVSSFAPVAQSITMLLSQLPVLCRQQPGLGEMQALQGSALNFVERRAGAFFAVAGKLPPQQRIEMLGSWTQQLEALFSVSRTAAVVEGTEIFQRQVTTMVTLLNTTPEVIERRAESETTMQSLQAQAVFLGGLTPSLVKLLSFATPKQKIKLIQPWLEHVERLLSGVDGITDRHQFAEPMGALASMAPSVKDLAQDIAKPEQDRIKTVVTQLNRVSVSASRQDAPTFRESVQDTPPHQPEKKQARPAMRQAHQDTPTHTESQADAPSVSEKTADVLKANETVAETRDFHAASAVWGGLSLLVEDYGKNTLTEANIAEFMGQNQSGFVVLQGIFQQVSAAPLSAQQQQEMQEQSVVPYLNFLIATIKDEVPSDKKASLASFQQALTTLSQNLAKVASGQTLSGAEAQRALETINDIATGKTFRSLL